ncbi:hypothetical protein Bca52824_069734 [Brassica carinata]|uniref:POTRA domain-containing protein n=1 Tax=Brassica carinata TaxID=52824 RepID=A0A8X7Q346_BRACI|nr:hypothetical protein Bca52824_069734 [Brassica carinata]
MANPADKPDPNLTSPDEVELREDPEDINGGEEEEEDEYEGEDDDEATASKPQSREDAAASRVNAQNLFRRMGVAPVPVRVHDVIVKGNEKTKDHVIEAEVDGVRHATTLQELLEAANVANSNLRALDIFDSVKITLDAGPPELPDTTNVVVKVVESQSPLAAEIITSTKSQARSSSLEGSLKYKNIFGHGDIWDTSLAYGCDSSGEVGLGLYLPRLRGRPSPFTSRVYLSTQDWIKFSSYRERALGVSLGVLLSKNHELGYTLAWRNLIDPTQMASRAIRRQIGHSLVSDLKYSFKVDERNSALRPTRGYSFVSTSQIGGLAPDSRTLRFLRQEFDVKYAVPLGFYRSALNFGVSGGITFPWGSGYKSRASSVSERFFLGGNISPVCSLEGPSALWGFKTRGLGPNEPRREVEDENQSGGDAYERDFVGGDVAVTAYADLSFDFPLRWFRERGIHGHVFACAGNMAELSGNKYRNFTLNYCHILKKQEHDRAKSGFFLTFSTPSS